jgi:hypothetical protein
MEPPECRIRHFIVADTPLRVGIAVPAETPSLRTTLADYGLIEAPPPADSAQRIAHIVLQPNLDHWLADELKALRPEETVCCSTEIYLQDSRVLATDPIALQYANADTLPLAGLETALTLHFARTGALILHACGFRLQSTDYLALGPSGSGKSTLAAAVLRAGGRLLTDDQLICYRVAGRIQAHWLRRNLLFRRGSTQCLPATLQDQLEEVTVNGETRYLLSRNRIADLALERIQPEIVLHLIPDTSGLRHPTIPQLDRLSQAQAFAGLLQAASPGLFGDRFATAAPLRSITAEMTAHARHYRLQTSRTLLTAPQQEFRRIHVKMAQIGK